MQVSLRVERGLQRVGGRVERDGERITNGLKEVSIPGLDGLLQDLTMPREQCWQRIRMFLRENRAAFDIGEQEGDRPIGKTFHAGSIQAIGRGFKPETIALAFSS